MRNRFQHNLGIAASLCAALVMAAGCNSGTLTIDGEGRAAEGLLPDDVPLPSEPGPGPGMDNPGTPSDPNDPNNPSTPKNPDPTTFFDLSDEPVDVGIRMMTRSELKRSIGLRTGVVVDVSGLPEELKIRNLKNDARKLRIRDGGHLKALVDMATVVSADSDIGDVVQCDAQRCTAEEVEAFLESFFVEPLESEDVQPYVELYNETFESAVGEADRMFPRRALLQQALISPRFLYRTEHGQGGETITTWELAKKLSFFLWGSLPDDELTELGLNGELAQAEIYQAQVERLLADDRTQERVIELFDEWLDMGKPNLELRPLLAEVDEGFEERIRREFELFVTRGVFEKEWGLGELLTAETSYMNQKLAEHYGIEGVQGNDFKEVDLPVDQGRKGLLTTAYVLVGHTKEDGRSPMRFGEFMMNALACYGFPSDAGLAAMSLPPGNEGDTLRERFEPLGGSAPCSYCHQTINAGFAFDVFDNLGRRWPEDFVAWEESYGTFSLPPHEPLVFKNTLEAIDGLAVHPAVNQCFVAQSFRFAQGQMPNAGERAVIEEIRRNFESNGRKIPSLLKAIAQSETFQAARR